MIRYPAFLSSALSVCEFFLKFAEVVGPGQVFKLSTSERLAALLRAAAHRGWGVFGVILSGWDIAGKKC